MRKLTNFTILRNCKEYFVAHLKVELSRTSLTMNRLIIIGHPNATTFVCDTTTSFYCPIHSSAWFVAAQPTTFRRMIDALLLHDLDLQ